MRTPFLSKLLCAATALLAAASSWAVAPNPYTLGVSFSFRITGVGNGIMTVYAEPGDTVGQTTYNATIESDIRTAWLRPNRQYDLVFGASGPSSYDLSFTAPDGYAVYVNGLPTDLYTVTPGGGEYTHYHTVELRPVNTSNSAPAGSFSGFQLGKSVTWDVGLGGLRNGRGAGTIFFKEQDLTVNPPAARDRLYYSKPANNGQIYVVRDGPANQRLRQIKTPQTVVDLVDDTNGYWLKFYAPAQASGPDDELTLYTFTGSPWKTLRVETPGAAQLMITDTEGTVSRVARLTAGSIATGSYTWTQQEGNGTTWLRTTTHTSTVPTAGQRDDTVVVRTGDTGGTIVAKTRYHYTTLAWGEELTEVVANPDAATAQQLKTTYAYHPSTSAYGNYRRIQSVTGPQGDWTSFAYHDDWGRRGRLEVESRPWFNAPTVPQPAATTVGRSVKYTYAPDYNGRQQLTASREEYIGGQLTGQSTSGFTLNQTRNGQPYTVSATTARFSSVAGLASTTEYVQGNGNPDFIGQPFAVKHPNQSQSSIVASAGSYNPSTKIFTSPGDGSHFRTIEWRGTTASAGATLFNTYDGLTVADLYLLPNQSTMEITIRDPAGNAVRTETQVFTGGVSFAPLTSEDFTYDSAGRLLTRTASNGAITTHTYANGYLTATVDPAGIETQFTAYDLLGRVLSVVKKGAPAAGGHAAQADLTTATTYDGANRVKTQVLSGTGTTETITTTSDYDLAGRVISQTPAGLGATTYAYDATARTQTVTAPDGGTTINTAQFDGQPASVTGTAVVAQFYSYGVEADGRRFTRVDLGTSTRWTKGWTDWLGRPTESRAPGFSISTQADMVAQNFYDATTGNLIKTTKTGYAPTLYVYDTLGQMTRSGLDVDNGGTLVLASLDRITDADARFENVSSAWWLKQTSTIYPVANAATAYTSALVRSRLTGFTGTLRNETQTTDIEGNTATATTMVSGKIVTASTVRSGYSGAQTEVSYNGLAVSSTGHDGLTTSRQYDLLSRPWKTTDSRSNVTTAAYYTNTPLAYSVADDLGTLVSRITYDPLGTGRVVLTQDAQDQTTRQAYNLRGQVIRQWGSATYPVEYGYDATYGDRTTQSTYRTAPAGDSATWPSVGPADTTTWTMDAATALIWKKTDAAAKVVEFDYNVRGQTASRKWARNVTTTYAYSSTTGELTGQTYSDGTPAVAYTYTRLGQEGTVADYIGTRNFIYETAKPWRLQNEVLPSTYGGRALTHLYETSGVIGRYRGFQLGTSPGSFSNTEQTYAYTASGRFSTLTSKQANNNAGQTATYQYAYEVNAPLVNAVTVTGVGASYSVARTYEPDRDLLASVDTKWSTTSVARFDYTHDTRYQRQTAKQGGTAFADYYAGQAYSAVFNVYGYNARGELHTAAMYRGNTPSATPSAADELPGRRFEYRYDSIGNRLNSGPTGNPANVDDQYTTNALNQYTAKENNLVQVIGTAAPTATVAVGEAGPAARKDRAWAADLLPANATSAVKGTVSAYAALPGAGSGGADIIRTDATKSYFVPKAAQTFGYDDDGNLTHDSVWDYTYDAENRLVSQQHRAEVIGTLMITTANARRLEYKYDYRGRRVAKIVKSGTDGVTYPTTVLYAKFIYHGWNLVGEYLSASAISVGNITRVYTWGLDASGSLTATGGVGALLRVFVWNTNLTYVPAHDGNGNVVALLSSTGALAAAYEYDPFGNYLRNETIDTVMTDQPFRFSSKFADKETGQLYYGSRYYSPTLGRFINRDSIGEAGGINLYAFVGNNGVNRWDYLGQYTIDEEGRTWFSDEDIQRFRDLYRGTSNYGPEGYGSSISDQASAAWADYSSSLRNMADQSRRVAANPNNAAWYANPNSISRTYTGPDGKTYVVTNDISTVPGGATVLAHGTNYGFDASGTHLMRGGSNAGLPTVGSVLAAPNSGNSPSNYGSIKLTGNTPYGIVVTSLPGELSKSTNAKIAWDLVNDPDNPYTIITAPSTVDRSGNISSTGGIGGRTIWYDPNITRTLRDGTVITPDWILAHELGHAADFILGIVPSFHAGYSGNTIPIHRDPFGDPLSNPPYAPNATEAYATRFANSVRNEILQANGKDIGNLEYYWKK